MTEKGKMKFSSQIIAVCLGVGLLIVSTTESVAFALLGPVQPWMQATNGVISPGDIGGPMSIGGGYRWNVPVVTYGFDQSFLDYFGSNGVAAVESAIQILNNLPPASQVALTNYPFISEHVNYEAQTQLLCDLKSSTLPLLLEQMGLAAPTRCIYVLRQWNPILLTNANDLLVGVFDGTTLTNYIAAMSYDPQTLNASPYINEFLYSGQVFDNGVNEVIIPFAVDFVAPTYAAVADFLDNTSTGYFYNGLTYDDVGGLSYLFSTNTVNYETLLSGVAGAGTNSSSYVNGAWRPGVDKITFIPQPVDSQSGAFLPATNYFTDCYFTNGVLAQQQMARVISQPDFLFSAADITLGSQVPFYARTGTTNWLNNAAVNGNTNGEGPGVIQPPVRIAFNKLGRLFESSGNISNVQVFDESGFWGSFDGSTNAPVAYPIPQSGTNQLTVRMWLSFGGNNQQSFIWKPASLAGAPFTMQTSTNLITWTTLFTITNNGSVCTYFSYNPASPNRFYRLIPQ